MSQAAFEKAVQIKTTGSTAWLDIPGNAATLNLSRELLDDTVFNSTGWRSRTLGIREYGLSVTAFWDPASAAFTAMQNAFLLATKLDFRYLPDGSNGFQGRAFVETFTHSGDVGALETVEINLASEGTALTTA